MTAISPRMLAFEAALAASTRRLADGDPAAAFASLERAHVLGQRNFGSHLLVHLRMLRIAWDLGDGREVRGQLLRIALTPIGHLFGRLPRGNTGASNVSAFAPMAIEPELERLLQDKER
jgi:Protein of unknown function (DUF3703)